MSVIQAIRTIAWEAQPFAADSFLRIAKQDYLCCKIIQTMNKSIICMAASKCGFTPQYDGLEALYKKYQDQGFVILGFPCDQFKHQEPGSDEEIAEFCRINHGVTFPLMKKIDVFGENAHPIFTYLCTQVPHEEVHGLKDKATMKLVDSLSRSEGRKDGEIRWNFTKFLISKDGSVIKRFPPVAEPKDMEAEIEAMLK